MGRKQESIQFLGEDFADQFESISPKSVASGLLRLQVMNHWFDSLGGRFPQGTIHSEQVVSGESLKHLSDLPSQSRLLFTSTESESEGRVHTSFHCEYLDAGIRTESRFVRRLTHDQPTNHQKTVTKSDERVCAASTVERKFVITEEMIRSYGEHVGGTGRIHFDSEFARQLGFRGALVHGLLLMAHVASLLDFSKLQLNPVHSFKMRCRFKRPVVANEPIVGCVTATQPWEAALFGNDGLARCVLTYEEEEQQ